MAYRFKSRTTTAVNTVNAFQYSMSTAMPANEQKLFRARIELWAPTTKAIAFVNEVMVIDGPASAIANYVLFQAGIVIGV